MPKTIAELAREAGECFTTKERGDETITVLKDDRPEWVFELVHSAHGSDFLPDDWRYSKIEDALNYIAETEDEDGHEFADGAVDVYTHDRHKWLGSNLSRSAYVDEARSEGLIGEDTDLTDQIGIGQYQEAMEVFTLVLEALRERVDEDEEETLEAARELGRDAGRNAASWCVDGNAKREERARVLAMLEDGDPAAYDYLPNVPNLSGEWADDPTPTSLATELGATMDEDGDELEWAAIVDAIADAWQEGVDETFSEECERLLREFVQGDLPRDEDGRLSAWAWPGGYPLFYLSGDGSTWCVNCARQGDARPTITAAQVNYEDDETCSGCGATIEKAYTD